MVKNYELPERYQKISDEPKIKHVKPHRFEFRNVRIDDGMQHTTEPRDAMLDEWDANVSDMLNDGGAEVSASLRATLLKRGAAVVAATGLVVALANLGPAELGGHDARGQVGIHPDSEMPIIPSAHQ